MGRHGGAESIIRGLTSGLVRRGWDISWVVASKAVDAKEPVRHTAYRGTGLGAGLRLGLRRDSILHSHFAYSAWGHLLVPGCGPRIRTFYGPWAEEGDLEEKAPRWKRAAREVLDMASLRRADIVIVLSQFSAGQARMRTCRCAHSSFRRSPHDRYSPSTHPAHRC
jgi:hypothetical protein